MFQFQYKEFIWLLAVLLLFIVLFSALFVWKKRTKKRIGDEKLVSILVANYSSRKFALKIIICSLAFAIGVVSAMNPRKPGAGDAVNRKGIDVAIALDVSKSMLAADLAPNRLERARQFIGKLINEMPNDRIALILFAGKAYLQMPLTTDHGAARLFVSSAGPDAVPQQGTVISDALKMGAYVFTTTEKRYKTIILISDGEDHDEEALATAKELAEQGVMINTIGIGSPEGATIIDPATGNVKTDEAGNTVVSKLNEQLLQTVAETTNGVYTRLQGTDETVSVVKKQLAQIEKTAFTDVSQLNFTSYYMWLAAAMFLLLFAEYFIPERKKVAA